MHESFEVAARRWPDAVAVDVPPAPGRPARRTITYAELRDRAEHLAGAIHRTVGSGRVAAVLLPRTSEAVYLAQLAVLKSGSAYVCVDPAFPDQQFGEILRDSGASVLLTDVEGATRARKLGYVGSVIRTDQCIPAESGPLPPPPLQESIAYIIYTSGTTGRPKGIMIAHHSIAGLVRSDIGEFGLGPGDRVAQGSSSAYDSSVEEVWMALSSGATVVVMDDGTARLGPDLVAWLREERITVLCPPPTLLRATGCADPQRELPDLRLLYVGGEALPEDVAEGWGRGRRLVNGYGPTECTVTCLRADIVAGQPIAIGRPVPGMRAWALDEHLRPVPDGQPGELCMGGAGLAVGYLGLPELNATKFPEHPTLGRIYRTGDLVHRGPDGLFYYHGRIDSQVKLRGYRIELEAIESCVARHPGVREAACRVQGEGASEALAAHIVPANPAAPPHAEELKAHLKAHLPVYMIPSVFATSRELPRNAGGKLRRTHLPVVVANRPSRPTHTATAPGPENPVQELIGRATQEVLQLADPPSIDEDFFTDIGGSSLQAAMLITALRADPGTASITVRDLYECRTVRALAQRAEPPDTRTQATPELAPGPKLGSPAGVTLAQSAWLLLEVLVASQIAYLIIFVLLPWVSRYVGLVSLILLLPLVLLAGRGLFVLVPITVLVLTKKLLIGRYTPTRAPAWSGLFLRMWMVQNVARIVPWGLIAGTEFQCVALRALGARIGKRVHIHRGVDLHQGGWDLLEIGDDVTVSQDALLGLVVLEEGQIIVGPVTLADGATLDVRAGMGPHTYAGRNSWLAALASLPEGAAIPDGERWDGVPARRIGPAPAPPAQTRGGRTYSPTAHGIAVILSHSLIELLLGLPALGIVVAVVRVYDLDYGTLLAILTHPASHLPLLATTAGLLIVGVVVMVGLEALLARALGAVEEGVISRWSLGYIRVWLKTDIVTAAGKWLSGGLFWPVWLRWAGMDVGPRCEISTIIDVVPELVHIGEDTFLADGIYLAGPRIQQGTVTLAAVHLQRNTFLGNHVVVAGGQRLPDGILIGISTVADDRIVTPASSWFGHPPIELPRREIVELDTSLTHQPSWIQVANRLFWEWLRFAVPLVPMVVAVAWVAGTALAQQVMPSALFVVAGIPGVLLACALLLYTVVLALKWALLGRVRPGIHALWSCWCSRWDFLYVAWGMIAGGVLGSLEGTLLLPFCLRRMGMKIGKRVVLGGGFAQVVDPNMIEIGDGATVNAMFQAHTFEDRVLKIDHIRVGAWSTLGNCTVPLYGADIGDYAYVAPHSVIMKREHLQPGLRYEGAPTRQQCDQPQSALRPVVTRAASRSGRHRAVRQEAAAVPPPRPRPSADR